VRRLLATVCAERRFVGANRVSIGDSAMNADRKKPGVAFWAAVVVVVMVAYVASVGPVYWIASRIPATNTMTGGRVLYRVYWPIWELSLNTSIRHAFEDYARAGTAVDSFNK
jgi:hypothetical protein